MPRRFSAQHIVGHHTSIMSQLGKLAKAKLGKSFNKAKNKVFQSRSASSSAQASPTCVSSSILTSSSPTSENTSANQYPTQEHLYKLSKQLKMLSREREIYSMKMELERREKSLHEAAEIGKNLLEEKIILQQRNEELEEVIYIILSSFGLASFKMFTHVDTDVNHYQC